MKGELTPAILAWLAEHPESTCADILAGVDEAQNTSQVAACCYAMVKDGRLSRSGEVGAYRYSVASERRKRITKTRELRPAAPEIPTLGEPAPAAQRALVVRIEPSPDRILAVLLASGKLTERDVQLARELVL